MWHALRDVHLNHHRDERWKATSMCEGRIGGGIERKKAGKGAETEPLHELRPRAGSEEHPLNKDSSAEDDKPMQQEKKPSTRGRSRCKLKRSMRVSQPKKRKKHDEM